MRLALVLALLGVEVFVLAGGLWWTFRRAQLPVGWAGSLGLASVVGASQALLAMVVQVGLDLGGGRAALAGLLADRMHWASVTTAVAAASIGAPLALNRFLRLDARWTRALTRELIAGVIASTIGTLAVSGLVVMLFGVAWVLLGAR